MAGPSSSHHHNPSSLDEKTSPILVRLKPWLGILSWAGTSLAFVVALAFWKKEVFSGLDRLAEYLRSQGMYGHALLFGLIFITTIPPFPLYSTLIILSGYTYGTLTGFILSYTSALSGALIVFMLSRRFLFPHSGPEFSPSHIPSRRLAHSLPPSSPSRSLPLSPIPSNQTHTHTSLIPLIPPSLSPLLHHAPSSSLLLLIRLAPYPYNLLNVLLAASPLSLGRYTWCTALSLIKLLVHTSLGAGIHNFADGAGMGGAGGEGISESGSADNTWRKTYTVGGLLLCVGIFLYLAVVARRAVRREVASAGEREMEEWERDVEEEETELLGEERYRSESESHRPAGEWDREMRELGV